MLTQVAATDDWTLKRSKFSFGPQALKIVVIVSSVGRLLDRLVRQFEKLCHFGILGACVVAFSACCVFLKSWLLNWLWLRFDATVVFKDISVCHVFRVSIE